MKAKIERTGVTHRFSDSTIFNNIVHAVEVPPHAQPDIRTQTAGLLENLEKILIASGSSKAHLLMATIYLTDMADYDGMNEMWDAWLPTDCAPTRACVQVVRLANPAWRVEIAVTAVRI